jgi:hypothetical protein
VAADKLEPDNTGNQEKHAHDVKILDGPPRPLIGRPRGTAKIDDRADNGGQGAPQESASAKCNPERKKRSLARTEHEKGVGGVGNERRPVVKLQPRRVRGKGNDVQHSMYQHQRRDKNACPLHVRPERFLFPRAASSSAADRQVRS